MKMNALKEEVDRLLSYIQPYLTLANSHTVDFIVNDTWQQVIPNDIRVLTESNRVNNILDAFYNNDSTAKSIQRFVDEADKYELKHSRFYKHCEELNFASYEKSKPSVKIREFMSVKKLHEVESMSRFVAGVASLGNISLVVDIGSGKGYLTSILALQHHFKILGIDCSEMNITGAAKTTLKLEKKWKVYERQSQNLPKTKTPSIQTVKEPCSSNEEYHNKYKWKSGIVGDTYKQRIQRISKTTNMAQILAEEYPEDDHQNVLLVGLHTCGNLAAACLELYATNRDRIKSIVNIGCCYHLLEEKFVSNPDWLNRNSITGDVAFPMSEYLTNRRFALGRDARMCGTQKPINFKDQLEITNATRPLFYRALLQKLMYEKLSLDDFPQGMTGRIAHKCNSFPEYVLKAMKKLDVDLQVTEEYLDSFAKENISHWDQLKIFFILKSALSPVIESIILLDRMLYLYEKDITDVTVVRLFDPMISPRCHAIVALPPKSNVTL